MKSIQRTPMTSSSHGKTPFTPFSPEAPISRSLFVKSACASKRLCFLIGIVSAGMAGVLLLDDTVEAACPSAPSTAISSAVAPASAPLSVTTLVARHPVQVNGGVGAGDPDFEEILKENARASVESGEWARRLREKEVMLADWFRTPVFPETRPEAHVTTFTRTPTGLSAADLPSSALLNGFSRVYLVFDAGNASQLAFAQKVLHASSDPVRPIVAGGSLEAARAKLRTRVWADQGSVITRRLGLHFWPALVKLTAAEIAVWTPALNDEGIPHDPVPAGLIADQALDLSSPGVRAAVVTATQAAPEGGRGE